MPPATWPLPMFIADGAALPSPPKQGLLVRIRLFLIVTLLALTAMQPSIQRLSITVPAVVMVMLPTEWTSGDWPATIWASVQPGTPVLAAQQALAARSGRRCCRPAAAAG